MVTRIGDKRTFFDPKTFSTHEIEVTSKRGARAIDEHDPQTIGEFRKFTKPHKEKASHKKKKTKSSFF